MPLQEIVIPPKPEVWAILWDRAIHQSADYVEKHLADVLVFKNREQIQKYTISQLAEKEKAICLEFGVFTGKSVNFFSQNLPSKQFYGFDSFEGLSEDWKGHFAVKGTFSRGGALPLVNDNVSLIKGWFHESLPTFAKQLADDVAFLHVDSDIYEAAVTVLDEMEPWIKSGLLILFDEYFGYPNWQNGEFRAWAEFCKRTGVNYKYRAFATEQALVEVI